MKLEGKIAVISGGTTGMGAATAKLFRSEGATVVVTGSNPETLAAARRELEGIEVIASDAGDVAAIKALVAQIKSTHGRIDVLFVNAGIAQFAPVDQVDEHFFERQFDINARGTYFLVREAATVMPDGGSIVLTSSIAHARGWPNLSVYAASKAAVRSMGRSFAGELALRNIRVNVISPGPIDTPIWGKNGTPTEQIDAMKTEYAKKIPLGRLGRPEEVARSALFFASDDSSFTTGADLTVDGGMLDLV